MKSTDIPVNIPVNWFDILVVIVLILGFRKGRTRGMSEELMPLLQWITILFAGAFMYLPLGNQLVMSAPISHLSAYIASYIGLAIVIKITFSIFKKAVGGKPLSDDFFGAGEYYLGMFAGMLRFACYLMACLAVLNAPYFDNKEVAKKEAAAKALYGSNYFPQFSTIQKDVLKSSFIGGFISKEAGMMLIVPTKPEKIGLKQRKEEYP